MALGLSRAVGLFLTCVLLAVLPLAGATAQQPKSPEPRPTASPPKATQQDKPAPPKTAAAPRREEPRTANPAPSSTGKKAEPPPRSTGEPALKRRKP